jgi:hypothetical protein
MKSIIPHILVLLFTLSGCSKDSTTTTGNSLNGNWKLIKYYNLTTGTDELEPADNARSIIIAFRDDQVNGNMNGHTVTNTVEGQYQLSGGNKMKTISFGGTKVGEPAWGDKFWDAIFAASSYERSGNTLHIFYNSDTEKMEFKTQ